MGWGVAGGRGMAPEPAPYLSRANEEIAQVRSKAQAEAVAFQASLRKEQMRVHSLEKAVEQKVGTGPGREHLPEGHGPLPSCLALASGQGRVAASGAWCFSCRLRRTMS